MNQMKKDTFLQRAKEKVRNKASLYMGVAAMGICVGAVFAAKNCGEPGSPFSQPPPLCENFRGDGICCESESYPFLRNPNGTVKTNGNGAPVPNPHYSLEDCHDGDNVCQNGATPAEVRDAAGRPAARIMERFLDGRPITLPLESESSQDCIMQVVRDNPCGPRVPGTPDLTRPRMTGPRVLHSMRQRAQQEIEEMRLHPESLRAGDNYFVVINNYEEVCTTARCGASDMHADIGYGVRVPQPRGLRPGPTPAPPPTCRNGKLDRGEQCDPRYRGRPRGGCDEGSRCTMSCTCESASAAPADLPEQPDRPRRAVRPARLIVRHRRHMQHVLPVRRAPGAPASHAGRGMPERSNRPLPEPHQQLAPFRPAAQPGKAGIGRAQHLPRRSPPRSGYASRAERLR